MENDIVFLVSSSGGHWVQLNKLLPAFSGYQCVFMTTQKNTTAKNGNSLVLTVPDSSRWTKLKLMHTAFKTFFYVMKYRPKYVVSTGAAPGLFAIIFGKALGAKTIWVDSIANVNTLSLSGKLAGKFSDLWLTQWEHLAKPTGPFYLGSVI